MEEKTVSFDAIKRKLKIEQAKRKVASTLKAAPAWCVQNKELALGMAAGFAWIGRTAMKIHSSNREDFVHNRRHWDPRTGNYVETRRKLTRNEQIELDNRYRADRNETKLHILYEMGLLK